MLKVEVWNGCSADYFQIGNTKHCGEDATDFAALQNVSVSIGTELQWIADGSIVREGYTVCFKEDATTAPTAMPTASPSKNPTRHPTGAPSTQPTRGPTDVPSTYPTLGPVTDAPTRAGETFAPTTTPTRNPSATPTTPPTSAPTGTPTGNPTAHPTTSPVSSRPSSAPSISPTPGIVEITLPPTSADFVASTKRPTPAPTACVRDCGGDDDYFNDEDDVPAASPVSPPSPPAPPPAETANAGVTIDEESQSAVVVVIIVVFLVVGILLGVVVSQKKQLDSGSNGGHAAGVGFFGVDVRTIKGAGSLVHARPVPMMKKPKAKAPVRVMAGPGMMNMMYEDPAEEHEPGWEPGDGVYDVPTEKKAPAAKKRSASVVSRVDNTEALYDLGTTSNALDDTDDDEVPESGNDAGHLDVDDDDDFKDSGDEDGFHGEPKSVPAPAPGEAGYGFE